MGLKSRFIGFCSFFLFFFGKEGFVVGWEWDPGWENPSERAISRKITILPETYVTMVGHVCMWGCLVFLYLIKSACKSTLISIYDVYLTVFTINLSLSLSLTSTETLIHMHTYKLWLVSHGECYFLKLLKSLNAWQW